MQKKPQFISDVNKVVYNLDWDDFTAFISKSKKVKGDIVIPRIIKCKSKNFAVISIEESAFYYNDKIQSISFEDGSLIEEIGDSAFSHSSIRKVNFPQNSRLRDIGSYCFNNCKNLFHILLPPSLRCLGSNCFLSSGIKSFECDTTNLSIGSSCFCGCSLLKKIFLPKLQYFSYDNNGLCWFNLKNFTLYVPRGAQMHSKSDGFRDYKYPLKIEYVDPNESVYNNSTSTMKMPDLSKRSINQDNSNGKLIEENQRLKLMTEKLMEENRKLRSDVQNLTQETQKLQVILMNFQSYIQQNFQTNIQLNIQYQTKLNTQPNANPQEIGSISIEEIIKYHKIEKIGEGPSSKIFKVVKNNRQIYAQKIFKNIENQNDNFLFIYEYEIMSSIQHPCVLKVYGYNQGYEERDISTNEIKNVPPCLILSYQPSTLEKELPTMTNTEKVCVISEILATLQYLQEICHIIHRNLKPSNILMNLKKHIRITDFRNTIELSSKSSLNKAIESLFCMAPELLKHEEYTEKIDQYSFGIILYFILMNGSYPKLKIDEIVNGKQIPLPNSIPTFAQDIIRYCCSYNPRDRPTFSAIINVIVQNNYAFFPNVDTNPIISRMDHIYDTINKVYHK